MNCAPSSQSASQSAPSLPQQSPTSFVISSLPATPHSRPRFAPNTISAPVRTPLAAPTEPQTSIAETSQANKLNFGAPPTPPVTRPNLQQWGGVNQQVQNQAKRSCVAVNNGVAVAQHPGAHSDAVLTKPDTAPSQATAASPVVKKAARGVHIVGLPLLARPGYALKGYAQGSLRSVPCAPPQKPCNKSPASSKTATQMQATPHPLQQPWTEAKPPAPPNQPLPALANPEQRTVVTHGRPSLLDGGQAFSADLQVALASQSQSGSLHEPLLGRALATMPCSTPPPPRFNWTKPPQPPAPPPTPHVQRSQQLQGSSQPPWAVASSNAADNVQSDPPAPRVPLLPTPVSTTPQPLPPAPVSHHPHAHTHAQGQAGPAQNPCSGALKLSPWTPSKAPPACSPPPAYATTPRRNRKRRRPTPVSAASSSAVSLPLSFPACPSSPPSTNASADDETQAATQEHRSSQPPKELLVASPQPGRQGAVEGDGTVAMGGRCAAVGQCGCGCGGVRCSVMHAELSSLRAKNAELMVEVRDLKQLLHSLQSMHQPAPPSPTSAAAADPPEPVISSCDVVHVPTARAAGGPGWFSDGGPSATATVTPGVEGAEVAPVTAAATFPTGALTHKSPSRNSPMDGQAAGRRSIVHPVVATPTASASPPFTSPFLQRPSPSRCANTTLSSGTESLPGACDRGDKPAVASAPPRINLDTARPSSTVAIHHPKTRRHFPSRETVTEPEEKERSSRAIEWTAGPFGPAQLGSGQLVSGLHSSLQLASQSLVCAVSHCPARPSHTEDSKPPAPGEDTRTQSSNLVPEHLVKVLHPHQIAGVEFMWTHVSASPPSGCILADAMGLGKTLQIICVLHKLLSSGRCRTALVLAPASVVRTWHHQFERWLAPLQQPSLSVHMIDGSLSREDRDRALQAWVESTASVLLLSYELFRRFVLVDASPYAECLARPGPDVVVLDEGHRIRHLCSGISHAVSLVQTPRRVVVTGYPVQNNLREYWAMVDTVRPGALGLARDFHWRFDKPISAGQEARASQHFRMRARRRAWILHNTLKPFVLRRDESLLSSQLPPKSEITFVMRQTPLQHGVYQQCTSAFRDLASSQPISYFWIYDVLSMCASHPEILSRYITNGASGQSDSDAEGLAVEPLEARHRLAWLPSFLRDTAGFQELDVCLSGKTLVLLHLLLYAKHIGDRVVVFTRSLDSFYFIVDMLRVHNAACSGGPDRAGWCLSYLGFHGTTDTAERARVIAALNDPTQQCDLLLVSTLAGGEGVTMTGANRVVLFDLNWNPSHDLQAAARVYRFGQKKRVFIYRFVMAGTVEERVYERQVNKQGLARWVVDDQAVRPFHNSDNKLEMHQLLDTRSSAVVDSWSLTRELDQLAALAAPDTLDSPTPLRQPWMDDITYALVIKYGDEGGSGLISDVQRYAELLEQSDDFVLDAEQQAVALQELAMDEEIVASMQNKPAPTRSSNNSYALHGSLPYLHPSDAAVDQSEPSAIDPVFNGDLSDEDSSEFVGGEYDASCVHASLRLITRLPSGDALDTPGPGDASLVATSSGGSVGRREREMSDFTARRAVLAAQRRAGRKEDADGGVGAGMQVASELDEEAGRTGKRKQSQNEHGVQDSELIGSTTALEDKRSREAAAEHVAHRASVDNTEDSYTGSSGDKVEDGEGAGLSEASLPAALTGAGIPAGSEAGSCATPAMKRGTPGWRQELVTLPGPRKMMVPGSSLGRSLSDGT